MLKRWNISFLILIFCVVNVFSAINVKVYSKDEGFGEANISKPRIYIQNTGTETISNFVLYYYYGIWKAACS